MGDEAEHLDAEHRKDAGHEVQNEATNKGEGEGANEADRGRIGGGGGGAKGDIDEQTGEVLVGGPTAVLAEYADEACAIAFRKFGNGQCECYAAGVDASTV